MPFPMRNVLLLLFAALLCSCGGQNGKPKTKEAETSLLAMGTYITMRAAGTEAEGALQQAAAEIRRLEKLWSVTDPDSEISALNRAQGRTIQVSPETAGLLAFALRMAEKTGGAFDPSIYPLTAAWGFPAQEYRVPPESEIAACLAHVGWARISLDKTARTVTVPDGAGLDFGGIAKGRAGDAAAECLRRAGVRSALLNLGGNIQLVGQRPDGTPWNIGIRDPSGREILGAVQAESCAVVTSGSYERNFTGTDGQVYGHILNPHTGRPAESGLTSVTTVTGSGTLADALSTALFVMGAEKAARFWRQAAGTPEAFEMVLVTRTGDILVSEGLAHRFSPAGEERAAHTQILRLAETGE